MKRILPVTSLLPLFTLGLLASGCASTATGSHRSAALMQGPAQPLQVKAPLGSVLTVIRYPAVVETAAHDAYIKAYLTTPMGAQVRNLENDQDAATIADSIVVKSNYFALSLYKELVKRMPEHSVLLSPHAIKLDKNGTLISEPITQAESIGAATLIDFVAYSFPDPDKIMSNVPLTFGDLITPTVVVRTDHRAAPATDGLLMASAPLLGAAAGANRKAVTDSIEALENGDLKADTPELAFVSWLANKGKEEVATDGLRVGLSPNAAQVYPLEKILLDRQALAAMSGSSTDIDPLETAFSSAFADRIVAMLNDTNVDRAVMMGRAGSVAGFDPGLAALTAGGTEREDAKTRMLYAERLLDAEKKYLSVQSLRIYDGIYNGEMGAQVRDLLKSEYEVLEERRDLARKQNAATALAILGAVAAGASIAHNSNSQTYNYSDVLLTDALLTAAYYAGTKAFSYKRQNAAIGRNYLSSIVPAIEQQTNVQVNLLDSSETITAIRFEDLQDKLHTLYDKNQRSMDVIASRCRYSPDGATQGVWLGVCENGVAAGEGVGAARQDGGFSQEYYGQAKNGRANGKGFMIYHRPDMSYSIEGRFIDGEPDGIVKVSKPGRPDQMRIYERGRDMGAAPAGSTNPSPFDVTALLTRTQDGQALASTQRHG